MFTSQINHCENYFTKQSTFIDLEKFYIKNSNDFPSFIERTKNLGNERRESETKTLPKKIVIKKPQDFITRRLMRQMITKSKRRSNKLSKE